MRSIHQRFCRYRFARLAFITMSVLVNIVAVGFVGACGQAPGGDGGLADEYVNHPRDAAGVGDTMHDSDGSAAVHIRCIAGDSYCWCYDMEGESTTDTCNASMLGTSARCCANAAWNDMSSGATCKCESWTCTTHELGDCDCMFGLTTGDSTVCNHSRCCYGDGICLCDDTGLDCPVYSGEQMVSVSSCNAAAMPCDTGEHAVSSCR